MVATLLLTGLATFAVGFVPTYDQVGIWGAVILTIIRFIQGVGVGGEWGGSVLLSMEWARTNAHRGFITSWPQLGGSAGALLANTTSSWSGTGRCSVSLSVPVRGGVSRPYSPGQRESRPSFFASPSHGEPSR